MQTTPQLADNDATAQAGLAQEVAALRRQLAQSQENERKYREAYHKAAARADALEQRTRFSSREEMLRAEEEMSNRLIYGTEQYDVV